MWGRAAVGLVGEGRRFGAGEGVRLPLLLLPLLLSWCCCCDLE